MTETLEATRVVPLHDLIVVEVHKSSDISDGGVIIPEDARKKSQYGTVLSVGPGLQTLEGDFIPLTIEPGDEVVFPLWSGSEIEIDGEEVLIIHESDILARIS